MIITGISDSATETQVETREKIVKLFNILGVEANFDRAHRLGNSFNPDYDRKIAIHFISILDKDKVLQVKKQIPAFKAELAQLTRNTIFINPQYGPLTEFARYKLRNYAKLHSNGNRFFITFNRLKMNGFSFRYDRENDKVVKV